MQRDHGLGDFPQGVTVRSVFTVRGEERERDGHIDLTYAAFLACGDLLDVRVCT